MDTKEMALKIEQIEKTDTREYRFFKFLFLGLTFLCMLFAVAGSKAQQLDGRIFNNTNADGVILDGYDAVAFFTDNKPVKGDAEFQFTYDKAVYHFISQEHLDLFKADPEKYKPQFGGWCAYAVSLGRVAPIDVNTFSIANNRLVIQHNQRNYSNTLNRDRKLQGRYITWICSAAPLFSCFAVLTMTGGRERGKTGVVYMNF
jgi:YHS domain-containing protein